MPRRLFARLFSVVKPRRLADLWATSCVAVALAMVSFPSPAFALGPSFDCTKVQTPLAQFICGSPVLSKEDLEFVQPYYALRQQVGPDGWQKLKVEAVNFQTYVAQQCGIPSSGLLPTDKSALRACLIQMYEGQESAWQSRLQGPALEEALRPIETHIALQARLQTLGFIPQTEVVDGVYGAVTRTAIENWQKASGLPVTGFLGNVDAEKLTSSSAATTDNASPADAPTGTFQSSTQPGFIPMADLAAIYSRAHQ